MWYNIFGFSSSKDHTAEGASRLCSVSFSAI